MVFGRLREDRSLASHGVTLDFGRVRNVNKNPVAEKGNQEPETELLRQDKTHLYSLIRQYVH